MKTDIALTLNKLIAYARDNLMLDALDEVYTLNRLASLCGAKAVKPGDVETEQSLDELLAELKAAASDVDIEAVKDAIMPAPHMVDFYFRDEFARNPEKALDFLYDLYVCGGIITDGGTHGEADGYAHYAAGNRLARPVMLDAGTSVPYTPESSAFRIAALSCDDVLAMDTATRLYAYASSYDGTIARRGNEGDYLVCDVSAIARAAVKKNVKDGAVSVDLLDYPAPALMVSGVAKNAVVREASAIMNNAASANLPYVAAASKRDGKPVVYVVLANALATDDIIVASDALGCCGVVPTPEFAPLLSVLEKGTALSSDLFAFKPLYSQIGGVKLGAKAAATLDGAVAKRIRSSIAAASSATEEQAIALSEKA